ncbi:MAG: choice-of-anchor D domain-containing protein [Leptospiraceae bacterium]|nr:choice-of-anchor D domain-containing protein [Leptospiraceae bacterium]
MNQFKNRLKSVLFIAICSPQFACFLVGGGSSGDSSAGLLFALLGVGGASVTTEEAPNNGPKPLAIEVRQNGSLISSGGEYDFGGRVNNTNGPDVVFVVKNTGTEALTFSGSVVQDPSADFLVTQDSITSLAVGAEHEVNVSFQPKSLGLRSSTLRINGPSNTSAYSISVYGNSTATTEPEIRITQASNLNSGSSYSFGNVQEATLGTAISFTIHNVGSAALTFPGGSGALTLAGTNASEFTIVGGFDGGSLAAGATRNFSLRFNPNDTGSLSNTVKTATLTLVNNDSDEGNFQITLNGTATPRPQPEISVTQNGNPIASGATYNFGSRQEFTTSPNITFTIRNEGNANLTLTNNPNFLFKSGTNGADFTITQPNLPSGILAPNETTTFTVSFTPSSVASGTSKVGSIAIANNDFNESPYTILLAGTSTPTPVPDINIKQLSTNYLTGATFTYPDTTENTTGNLVIFSIENLGQATLNLTGTPRIAITGTNASDFALSAFSTSSVAAGSFTTFSVRFNPSLASGGNPKTATLSIPSNDPDEPTYTLILSGTSLPRIPDIHLTSTDSTPVDFPDGSSFNFGTSKLGVEVTKDFRIRNLGNKILTLTGSPRVSITGTDPTHFFLVSQPSATVATSSSSTITVYYTPLAEGASSASLVIASDDPDEPTYTINLSGTGVANTAPCFSISNFTASLPNSASNFYGTGKTLFYSNFINIDIGKQNPSAIIHIDQNHIYQDPDTDYRPLLFYWYNPSGSASVNFRGNPGVTSTTTMVPIGSNSSFYSNSTVWGNSSTFNFFPSNNNNTFRYDVNAPATSPSMSVNQVRSCSQATYQESFFSIASGGGSSNGLSHIWNTRKKMRVNLIFVDGTYSQQTVAGLQTAVDRMKTIYAQDTVKVDLEFTATVLSNSEYLTIAELSDDTASVTSSLSKLYKNTGSVQDANSLNIYITKDESQVGGVLGISSGIPGLPGITGTKKAGMVVFLEAHRSSGSVGDVLSSGDQIFLGDTMAHEAGHFLGLYHLVESSGLNSANNSSVKFNQDPLLETPVCFSSRDTNSNGRVDISECLGTGSTNSGALNLMFWAGDGATSQTQLTGEQGWIIRRNPLAY